MTASPGHIRVLRKDLAPYQVSADAALQLVERTRRQGGFLALMATIVLLFVVLGCAAAAADHPLALIGTVLGGWPLILLFKHGLRTGAEVATLDAIARLPRPQTAAVIDRTLIVGASDTPIERWHALALTADQEQAIRRLALPQARLV